MLTVSKALSSGQAQKYHKLEFTSKSQSYYGQGDEGKGEWQGKLAASLGLKGNVAPLEFSRLAEGVHPQTEEPMVRHRVAMDYKNPDGTTTKAVEHRAGWDATFSAPKSVSLTALVGGDDRVREAHRAAVTTALDELERYTQARIGGNNPAETTGKFIAAKFEHDTARPVDGYAAPQLHTHAVIFNMTERENGSTRALQERAFFESQQYATAVYQHANTRSFLNDSQRRVIEEVLNSSDRIHGLQGLAGSGKTTTLQTIREGAETNGYIVEGFAPTSKAAGQLREAGIDATTLQSFLARGQNHPSADPANRHLYMLDESSLASTKQMQSFLSKLNPNDRVLVIGDTRQHQGVDAGRPFQQMQEAGMQTSQLDRIMRQKDPELLKAVQHLANNETVKGVAMLAEQGRVTEIPNGRDRIAAIARDYAAQPQNTIASIALDYASQIDRALIVAPDAAERRELTQLIRSELQAQGRLSAESRSVPVLIERDLGNPRLAANYAPDDRINYRKGSPEEHGIADNSSATVVSVDARSNLLTVETREGDRVSYNPALLKQQTDRSTVYTEGSRELAQGERIQFNTANPELRMHARSLATVEKFGEDNAITVRLDNGKTVELDGEKSRYIDYGFRSM